MTEKIVTKIFNYGDEKESSWPPRFGTGGSGVYHMKDGKLVEGYPPDPNPKFDKAPTVIGDTIDAFYHQAACTMVDSRSKLKMIDKACGTITTDKPIAADPSFRKANDAARRKDAHEALHKAVAQLDAGTAPLSEETRALCAQQNEIVSSALNMDAFNVAGRKDDKRGKRFKRGKRGRL